MAKSKKAKRLTVDFDDEDSVLAAMAWQLDVPIEDLSIKASHYGDFGTGDYYQIDLGSKEYFVAKDEDSAHALAVAVVKQDLEESPEIFEPNFIESHIDTKHLAKELYSDVHSERYDYFSDLAEQDAEDFWKSADLKSPPDEDDDGNMPSEVASKYIDEAADAATDEMLKDPIQYLEEIYGREDAVKKAIEIAGIDVDAAAEEAVNADGPGHFLASYDGHLQNGPDGIVYWRGN